MDYANPPSSATTTPTHYLASSFTLMHALNIFNIGIVHFLESIHLHT